jgi:hypothetical protein
MDWGTVAQLAVVAGGLTLWVVASKYLRCAPDEEPDDWANRNSW